MCSISGAIILKPLHRIAIWNKLKSIILRAEERGRDSFGVTFIDVGKTCNYSSIKHIGKVSENLDKLSDKFLTISTKFIINNNRAEPTNEYVAKKTLNDVQPFLIENILIAHNGTIANDKILCSEKLSTDIDSARLAYYLSRNWNGNLDSLKRLLYNNIKGSFALAIHNKYNPKKLFLACNYKPLYIQYDNALNAIFFSSFPEYFGADSIYNNTKTEQIPAYSIAEINSTTGAIIKSPLNNPIVKKVLVICSGGLDSVVVANHYLRLGYKTDLIHFKYKCRAELKEIEAVENVAKYFSAKYNQDVKVHYVDTDIFKNVIGHSRLTNTNCELVLDGKGEASAEFAHEYVPCRNLVLYSIASAFAEAHGYNVIALGNNLEEASAYSDNEYIFTKLFNNILPHATNLNHHITAEAPVAHLMKHEIVKKGIEEGAPLQLTHSCYEGREKHCGVCGPCYMRKIAFKMNNFKEVIDYEDNTTPER